MKFLTGSISFLIFFMFSYGKDNQPRAEIEKEIKKLEELRKEIKQLIAKNQQILEKIKKEREKLEKEKKELEDFVKKLQSEKYKKLAKVFEKAVDEDPELAAEKMSKIKDPKEAAYIIFNMKEAKAGILIDYMDPEMADKIVRIITQIRKNKNK